MQSDVPYACAWSALGSTSATRRGWEDVRVAVSRGSRPAVASVGRGSYARPALMARSGFIPTRVAARPRALAHLKYVWLARGMPFLTGGFLEMHCGGRNTGRSCRVNKKACGSTRDRLP